MVRRNGNRAGKRAHLAGGRLAELVAARSDAAGFAPDGGGPGLKRPLTLGKVRAFRRTGALPQTIDVRLHGGQPAANHAVPERGHRVAHAAAGVVQRPASRPGTGAATPAAAFLPGHLAFGPGHHVVELAAHGIKTRRNRRTCIARILLQAGKAAAGRFLAGDKAPPEPVAEPDRPDGQEQIERDGDEPLGEATVRPEGLPESEPHQERQGHHHQQDQQVIGDRQPGGRYRKRRRPRRRR